MFLPAFQTHSWGEVSHQSDLKTVSASAKTLFPAIWVIQSPQDSCEIFQYQEEVRVHVDFGNRLMKITAHWWRKGCMRNTYIFMKLNNLIFIIKGRKQSAIYFTELKQENEFCLCWLNKSKDVLGHTFSVTLQYYVCRLNL